MKLRFEGIIGDLEGIDPSDRCPTCKSIDINPYTPDTTGPFIQLDWWVCNHCNSQYLRYRAITYESQKS